MKSLWKSLWMAAVLAAGTALSAFSGPRDRGPEHRRLFKRTVYLTEIPLAHAYSNGNLWTGYAHRWTDWPLMVDRSLQYIPGYNYRHTIPDMQRTLREIRDAGIDGAIFNVTARWWAQKVGEICTQNLPVAARLVPDYPPTGRHYNGGNWHAEDQDWFAPAFTNRHGIFYRGRPIVSAYDGGFGSPEEMRKWLDRARSACGEFFFLPFCPSGARISEWMDCLRKGLPIPADEWEKAKEQVRARLRIADGVQFCDYVKMHAPFDGEYSLDTEFCRNYGARIFREVFDEPEFKGKKALGMVVGMGHANSYTYGNYSSSDGTRTLRDALTIAHELDPDVVTFFEWDEWNENTGVRPTLWNSFAPTRIIRAMRAEHEGRENQPLAGDDTSVPNLILSFRKTLSLGETAQFEVVSVPDTSAVGPVTVSLKLQDENGRTLKTFKPVSLDTRRMEERRFKCGSEDFGNACAAVPVLTVRSSRGTRTWGEGLPFMELRPTANWDHKWVLMPLRDLAAGGSCRIKALTGADGKEKVSVSAAIPAGIDRLETLDGGDIVRSKPGSAEEDWREDGDHYVFSIMAIAYRYPKKDAHLEVTGVSEAEWMIVTNRTSGMRLQMQCQATNTPDSYLRIRKGEAARAVVRLVWPEIGTFEIPLKKVLESGMYSVAGPYWTSFSIHRFLRQTAFFSPVNAQTAQDEVELVPDLPVSVIGAHALTADGKICRSRPVVVGRRSGEKVPIRVWSEFTGRVVKLDVDRERVPVLDYDLSGEKAGVISPSGFGCAFNGSMGGYLASATRRNRGCGTVMGVCAADRRQVQKEPTAPRRTVEDGIPTLEFDGSGTYFVMPGGVLSRTAAYRLSFDFRSEPTGGVQELFGSGSPYSWGSIGYLRIESDGIIRGIGLSVHEHDDASLATSRPVRPGWNHLEIVHRVDSIELVLNGDPSGPVRVLPPGRFDSPCWFGGRPGMLFKGAIRNVRCTHVAK